MTDDVKALVDQIHVQVQSAHSYADRPLYNHLEVGFRHTPLTPKEREQRYAEACRFAAQDSKEALRLIDELRPALAAQAEEIERLRAVLNKRVSAGRPLCRWCNGQRALPPFGECDCEERHYNPAIGCTTLRSGNDR